MNDWLKRLPEIELDNVTAQAWADFGAGFEVGAVYIVRSLERDHDALFGGDQPHFKVTLTGIGTIGGWTKSQVG
jgi:hypothetical protein